MNSAILKMSLINFDSNDNLPLYTKFITEQTGWLYGNKFPSRMLFIPQGYDGMYYNTYIQQVRTIFQNMGIGVQLITDGDPGPLIGDAEGIVVGGGDLDKLLSATVSYLPLLKDKIRQGTPYLGWNEGSVFASPYYVVPPIIPASTVCIEAIHIQMVCHFMDTPANRLEISNFCMNHQQDAIPISEIVCLKDGANGSGIQLEDDGSGMLYRAIHGRIPPTVFVYQNNMLIES